ncbi:MAG: hypothetical protein ACD_23C00492G0001 [uncultured bacterium]|nr:MAG: hypothetical protein ACD_23C00492G0001 [uncultured bacterium]
MIRNAKNGRFYIGSAMRFNKRWREHLRGLEGNRHHSKFMQRDWNKTGAEHFEFSILMHCTPDELIKHEQSFIDTMKPVYNSAPVAGSQLGYKFDDEAKAKMSVAAKRTKNFTGHTHSEETKARISAVKTGVKMGKYSDERAKKTAAAMRDSKNALQECQVREIRKLRETQKLTYVKIAALIGCTWYAVNDVIRGRTYKWVI